MVHRAATLRAQPVGRYIVGRYIGGLGNAGVTVTLGMRCLPAGPSGRSRCPTTCTRQALISRPPVAPTHRGTTCPSTIDIIIIKCWRPAEVSDWRASG